MRGGGRTFVAIVALKAWENLQILTEERTPDEVSADGWRVSLGMVEQSSRMDT